LIRGAVLARRRNRAGDEPRRYIPLRCPALHIALTIAAGVGCLGGCSQLTDPDLPEPFRLLNEPTFDTEYLVYAPSSYNRRDAWPLLVVCHDSFPDSPRRQINNWTQLAESRGFIVVAPRLPKGKGKQLLDAAGQAVLAVVDHVRAGHNISADRMFLHGAGEGAPVALRTGLGHADLFRAVSVNQPKFREEELSDVASAIDPYQPVLVQDRAAMSMYVKDGPRCIEWLREKGIPVRPDVSGVTPEKDYERVVDFYETIIQTEPWVRVRSFGGPGAEPLEVRFKVDSVQRLTNLRWEFGDGDSSTVAEPLHVYAQPGRYRVSLTAKNDRGREVRRIIAVSVPIGERPPDLG